jgi:hypothetical protein
MNGTSGLCEGCYRSLDEIAAWSGYDDAEKLRVLDAVAQRRAAQPSRIARRSGRAVGAP